MHIITTERETDLSVHKITDLILQEPKPMLINELGAIFAQEKCPVAEKTLIKMLHSPKPTIRYVAYCHLSLAKEHASPLAHHTLHIFRQSRRNARLVENAQKRLWI